MFIDVQPNKLPPPNAPVVGAGAAGVPDAFALFWFWLFAVFPNREDPPPPVFPKAPGVLLNEENPPGKGLLLLLDIVFEGGG